MIQKWIRKWLGVERDRRILESLIADQSYEKHRLYQVEDAASGAVLVRGLDFESAKRAAVMLAGSTKHAGSLARFGPKRTLQIKSNIDCGDVLMHGGHTPEGTKHRRIG